MDDEDVQVIAVEDRTGDVFVGAAFGTNGYEWPPFVEYKDSTYKFECNEPMTLDVAAHIGGYARYKLFATKPVMQMRLCEQRFVGLKPDMLYYFTVDPNCEACKRIAFESDPHNS
jgi:hypothetical protein